LQYLGIAIVATFVLTYSLVSRRLETTWITGPMAFVGFGVIAAASGVELGNRGMEQGLVRTLAEATLVLLLYTDAIRIDFGRLRRQIALPARLLGLGLPLTIIAGVGLALVLFPGLAFWEAAVLAAVLTPTDAALGQAVVTNPSVPVRIRQALNVESGLNDGLMLPLITLFIALAAVGDNPEGAQHWARFAAEQIGFGTVAGLASGYVGGRLIDVFATRNWIDGAFRQLGTLAIAVAAFAGAEALGGNGFVAAFVAGLAFGAAARAQCGDAYDFAEDEGQLLALLTFLFFGALIVEPALGLLTWQIGLYALLSLTVVRMVPVVVALLGTGLRPATMAFAGWFGPRGLASILFGLFVLEEAGLSAADDILLVVTWTVVLSIALHGATSYSLAERYGRWFAETGASTVEESVIVDEMPTR